MLKVYSRGLTIGECRELQAVLKERGYALDLQSDLSGLQYRSGVANSIPQFWLLITLVGTAVGTSVAVAGKAALDEAGKDAYRLVKEWLSKRFRPEDNGSIEVTIYGADGRPIDKLRRGR
jgi:hypothetical protein